jgi:hypothetical protein
MMQTLFMADVKQGKQIAYSRFSEEIYESTINVVYEQIEAIQG